MLPIVTRTEYSIPSPPLPVYLLCFSLVCVHLVSDSVSLMLKMHLYFNILFYIISLRYVRHVMSSLIIRPDKVNKVKHLSTLLLS